MNKVLLIGRLAKDPETKICAKNTKQARYTLAVNRPYKKNNKPVVDFISCLTIGHNAEFAEKYLRKGMRISVDGTWQTSTFTDKNGNPAYANDCVVATHEILENKKSEPEIAVETPVPEVKQPESNNDDLDFSFF